MIKINAKPKGRIGVFDRPIMMLSFFTYTIINPVNKSYSVSFRNANAPEASIQLTVSTTLVIHPDVMPNGDGRK